MCPKCLLVRNKVYYRMGMTMNLSPTETMRQLPRLKHIIKSVINTNAHVNNQ